MFFYRLDIDNRLIIDYYSTNMFQPKYKISAQLLANIKRVSALVQKLNDRRFPRVVFLELAKMARETSVFSSTSIEGNPLPLTEVKKVLKNRPDNIRDSEREVLNYNQALESLDKLLAEDKFDLSLNSVLDIHQDITTGLLPSSDVGKLRQKPVVVNDPRTGQVVYLPPDVDVIKILLSELIVFAKNNQNIVDPLILAGIFHKQMVIIHPFMDGNGRTTRLVTKCLLAKMGLNTFNLFSFEHYYNQNVTKYFQIVGEYGDYNEIVASVDFTKWLEYFTSGIIDELLRVEKLLPKVASSPNTRLAKHHQDIIRYIRDSGYIVDRDYARLTKRAKATRTLDFNHLIEQGIIMRKGKGRSTHYILKEI